MKQMRLPYKFTVETWHIFKDYTEKHEIVVDVLDADYIQQNNWHMGKYYVQSSIVDESHPNKNRHAVPLHRILTGESSDKIVHHVNGNKLDNRRCNLVLMNPSEHSRLHHAQGDIPKRGTKNK